MNSYQSLTVILKQEMNNNKRLKSADCGCWSLRSGCTKLS